MATVLRPEGQNSGSTVTLNVSRLGKKILEFLQNGPRPIDEILEHTGNIPDTLTELTLLELEGLVKREGIVFSTAVQIQKPRRKESQERRLRRQTLKRALEHLIAVKASLGGVSPSREWKEHVREVSQQVCEMARIMLNPIDKTGIQGYGNTMISGERPQELLQGIKSDTGEMVRTLKSMDRTLKNMDHWFRNTFGLTVEHMMLEEMPDPLEELLGERFIRTLVPELDFEGIDLVPDGIFEFERHVVIGEAKAGMVTLPRARNAIRQAKDHLKNFLQARKRKAWVRRYPFLEKEPLLLVYAAKIAERPKSEILEHGILVGIRGRVYAPKQR